MIEEQTPFNDYAPNGSTTVFPYTFRLFKETDLLVELDGVEVADGFTVAGVGSENGGSITFTAAPVGTQLVLKLAPTFDRSVDYQEVGDLLSGTLNGDLDRVVQLIQYLRQELGTAIKLPFETDDNQQITETATERALKLLGFDGSGSLALLSQANLSTATVTALAAQLLADATESAMRSRLKTADAAQVQEGVRFSSAGSAPAYTLTPTPAIAAYATGQRFTVDFHASGTAGSNTINISGRGAKSLKQYDGEGNKRNGITKANQIAVIEYDGTDFVILNPLRLEPVSAVRQTVQAGPLATGLPNFLPATSGTLSIASQNISASDPLIVSAAQGHGYGSDRIGMAEANLTWNGLSASTTNYLYVDVSSSGALTAGSTVVAPVYQRSGAISTAAGACTFDIAAKKMYAGNGSTAPLVWRVFVGEAVTSASAVTSVVMYAYNGEYDSGQLTMTNATTTTVNHNIGAPTKVESLAMVFAKVTPLNGYSIGDEYVAQSVDTNVAATTGGAVRLVANNRQAGIVSGATLPHYLRAADGALSAQTAADWRWRLRLSRDF